MRALNVARKWGEIKYNVAVDTEVPQVIQHKPPSLTEAQLDHLLDVISGDPLETLILVALDTGARISECLGLLWANIDRDEHLLHITRAIKRRKLDTPRDGKNYTTVRDSYTKTKDERDGHLPTAIAEVFDLQAQRQQIQRQQAGSA